MSKPLAGKTVVITRVASQADEFVVALEEFGATVIVCPMIEIAEPESYEQLDEALAHLYGYDWLIFTSANGVRFFLQRLAQQGLAVSELDELRLCAIGEATADHLRDAHVHVDLVATKSRAEGLFEALNGFLGGPDKLTGLNFLLPRAATGREYLPRALEAAGARVDVVTAYRTVLPPDVDRGKLGAMLTGSADCIAFTSSSAVKNFALLFDTSNLKPVLADLVVACIGEVTATTATDYGLEVNIQSNEASVKHLAHAIAEYYSG
jgi:uroporphyrinogen III methyltransferase/synthase